MEIKGGGRNQGNMLEMNKILLSEIATLKAENEKLIELCKESLDFIIAHIPEFGNEYLLIEELERALSKRTKSTEANQ